MSVHNQPLIYVVGSINMDLITKVPRFPQEGETITGLDFFTAPGGKGANQAVATARLGAKVVFIGAVGVDSYGQQLSEALGKEGINITHLLKVPGVVTGTAIITINKKAQNQIIVIPGANHRITEKQIDEAISKNSHKSGALLLQLEIPLPIVLYAAKRAKDIGLAVTLNPSPATTLPDELFPLLDYVIPNEHEAVILTGKNNPEKAAQKLKKMGARNIIITLGDKGALYLDDNSRPVTIKGYKIKAVDPTAAGDAFVATFTVALLEEKPIEEAIRFANAAGALAATKLGAQPSLPTRKEVEKFLQTHRS